MDEPDDPDEPEEESESRPEAATLAMIRRRAHSRKSLDMKSAVLVVVVRLTDKKILIEDNEEVS